MIFETQVSGITCTHATIIIYHSIYLTEFLRFKFCNILITLKRVLLKKISILSKILAFFSMAKIEILKLHFSDHRHTIRLKFQTWVDALWWIYRRVLKKNDLCWNSPRATLKMSFFLVNALYFGYFHFILCFY